MKIGMTFYTPSRVAELAAAFDLVVPSPNWKARIDVTLPALSMVDATMIHRAVVFYTGSEPTFTDNPNGTTRIVADGYYAAIGA